MPRGAEHALRVVHFSPALVSLFEVTKSSLAHALLQHLKWAQFSGHLTQLQKSLVLHDKVFAFDKEQVVTQMSPVTILNDIA